jgi:hypothetical protein
MGLLAFTYSVISAGLTRGNPAPASTSPPELPPQSAV